MGKNRLVRGFFYFAWRKIVEIKEETGKKSARSKLEATGRYMWSKKYLLYFGTCLRMRRIAPYTPVCVYQLPTSTNGSVEKSICFERYRIWSSAPSTSSSSAMRCRKFVGPASRSLPFHSGRQCWAASCLGTSQLPSY